MPGWNEGEIKGLREGLKMKAPFEKWTPQELEQNLKIVDVFIRVFGIRASRQVMEEIGFPIPPPELIDPIEVCEQRYLQEMNGD